MKYDNLLQLFLKTDRRASEWMKQPNSFGEYVYATDGHTFIRIKPELLEGTYDKHERTGDFDRVLESVKWHEPVTMSIEPIKEGLLRVEKDFQYEECDECDGDGVVHCEYGHEHECPECDGSGDIKLQYQPMGYVGTNECHVRLNGFTHYNAKYLDRLVKVAEAVGVNRITQIGNYGQAKKSQFFVVGDVEVLIMGCDYDNFDDEEKEKIKIVDVNAESQNKTINA